MWHTCYMPTPAIIERVRELSAQLAETPDAPSELVRELDHVRTALDVISLDPANAELYTSLRDKLLLAYVGFQIDHPQIAGTMQGLIDSLAAAGL